MKRTEVLGLRLNPTELATLRRLAEAESRSPASWVRYRVQVEAANRGLLAGQPVQQNQHEATHAA